MVKQVEKLKQLSYLPPLSLSERGRRGYLVAVNRMGRYEFHSAGGRKTASYDMWVCGCHGIGTAAYLQHPENPTAGKKHRYLKQ